MDFCPLTRVRGREKHSIEAEHGETYIAHNLPLYQDGADIRGAQGHHPQNFPPMKTYVCLQQTHIQGLRQV